MISKSCISRSCTRRRRPFAEWRALERRAIQQVLELVVRERSPGVWRRCQSPSLAATLEKQRRQRERPGRHSRRLRNRPLSRTRLRPSLATLDWRCRGGNLGHRPSRSRAVDEHPSAHAPPRIREKSERNPRMMSGNPRHRVDCNVAGEQPPAAPFGAPRRAPCARYASSHSWSACSWCTQEA